MAANEPYRESGKTGGAFLLPLVALAAAAASAFVYAFVAMSLPLVYFTPLLVVAFAFAASFPLGDAGRLLHVRSVPTMRAYGAMTGVTAVYFAWVFFCWHFAHAYAPPPAPGLWDWLQSPSSVWRLANAIAADGWYTLGSWTQLLAGHGTGGLRPSGGLLWTLWFVEAAIVVAACVHWAPRRIAGQPFCEACGRWLQPEASLSLSPISVKAHLLRRDGLASIQDVALPRPGTDHFFWIRSWRCASCPTTAVFRCDRVVGFAAHNLLSPRLLSSRLLSPWLGSPRPELRATSHADPVVPLSWLRPEDAAQLQRIAEALRTARFE